MGVLVVVVVSQRYRNEKSTRFPALLVLESTGGGLLADGSAMPCPGADGADLGRFGRAREGAKGMHDVSSGEPTGFGSSQATIQIVKDKQGGRDTSMVRCFIAL